MKLLKDNHGIAHMAIFLVVAILAIGAVGWEAWNSYKLRNPKQDIQVGQPHNTDTSEAVSDEEYIKEVLKDGEACEPTSVGGVVEVRNIKIHENFALASVGCTNGGGSRAILKKIDNEWEEISGTQNSCFSMEVKTKYGMTEEVRDELFAPEPGTWCGES